MRHIVLALAWGAWLTTAAVAEPPRLIAVLPLDATHAEGRLSEAARVSVEEAIRDAAVNVLSAHGWIVMSGENALQILADNGIDPTKCGDQSCHLGMARELKVEQFLSGAVLFVDSRLIASVRLIDTRSGRIVGSVRLTGDSATELQSAFEARAREFFARCGLLEAGGDPRPSPPVKEKVVEPFSNLQFVRRGEVWTHAALVPVDAYARCVWSGACFEPDMNASERCNWKRRRSEPVNCVDSARAKQFCEWVGGRLPSLAELTREEQELPSVFIAGLESPSIAHVATQVTTAIEPGEERFSPEVGVQCVLPAERVRALETAEATHAAD